jgi:hypothetical protein
MTKAIVNTKSNYNNLNGKSLKVVEQYDNFITCEFWISGQGIVKADFGRSEVVKIFDVINLNKFIGID